MSYCPLVSETEWTVTIFNPIVNFIGFVTVDSQSEIMYTDFTDSENILVVWAADVDSSQCIEDGGYISEIGEWDIMSRSWYSQVLTEKRTIVTEAYGNSSAGEMVAGIVSSPLQTGRWKV